MEAYERIIKLMEYLKLNKNSFSEEIGMSSNVTIGRIINEKRNPHPNTLKKIVNRFPDINYDWLKTGKGEMIKNEQNLEHAKKSVAIGRDANGSEIHITSQNVDEFIRITGKYQEHTDKMLAIIEKLINK